MNQLVCPCPHMIFDKDHYHKCVLLLSKDSAGTTCHCLCAWFYDLSNPGYSVELDLHSKGKSGYVSDFNFPDSKEIKEMRERTMTEDDVPKLCPKGYTLKQIDAKIKAFDPWITEGPEKKE